MASQSVKINKLHKKPLHAAIMYGKCQWDDFVMVEVFLPNIQRTAAAHVTTN